MENDWHIISAVEPNSPAANCRRLEIGAEIVEINNQIIIGWEVDKVRALLKDTSTKVIKAGGDENGRPSICSLCLTVRSYFPIESHRTSPALHSTSPGKGTARVNRESPALLPLSETSAEEEKGPELDIPEERTQAVPVQRHSKSDDELDISHKEDLPSSPTIRRKSIVKQAILEYIDKVYHDDSRALTSPSTKKTLDMVKAILCDSSQLSPSHLSKYGLLPLSPPCTKAARDSLTLPHNQKAQQKKNHLLTRRTTVDQPLPLTQSASPAPEVKGFKRYTKWLDSKRFIFWKNTENNHSFPSPQKGGNHKYKLYNQRLLTIPIYNNRPGGEIRNSLDNQHSVDRITSSPYKFNPATLTSDTNLSTFSQFSTRYLDTSLNGIDGSNSPTALKASTSTNFDSRSPESFPRKNESHLKKSLTFLYKYFHHRDDGGNPPHNTSSPKLMSYSQNTNPLRTNDTKMHHGGDAKVEGDNQVTSPYSPAPFRITESQVTEKKATDPGFRRKSPPYILPFYGDLVDDGGRSSGSANLPKGSLVRLRSSSDALDLAEPQQKFSRANKPKALILPPSIDNTYTNTRPNISSDISKRESLFKMGVTSEPSPSPCLQPSDLHHKSWVLVKKVPLHPLSSSSGGKQQTLQSQTDSSGTSSSMASPLDGVVVRMISPGAILPPSLNEGWHQVRADLYINQRGTAGARDTFSRDHLYLNLETPSWSSTQNKVNFQRESYYLPDFMVKPSIRMHNCIKLMNRDLIMYMALSSHGEFKKWLQYLKPISNGHYHIQQTIASTDNWPSSDESKSSPNIPSSTNAPLQKNTSFNDKLERLRTLFNLSPYVIRKIDEPKAAESEEAAQAKGNEEKKPYAFIHKRNLMGKALKFASVFHGGDGIDK